MLLDKRQAAKMLNISCRTLDRYRSKGYDLGQVRTPGTKVLFDPVRLEDSIRRGKFTKRKA